MRLQERTDPTLKDNYILHDHWNAVFWPSTSVHLDAVICSGNASRGDAIFSLSDTSGCRQKWNDFGLTLGPAFVTALDAVGCGSDTPVGHVFTVR